jgi:methyl-accepting chemotaxis protein
MSYERRVARHKEANTKTAGGGGRLSVEDGVILDIVQELEQAMVNYLALGESPLQEAVDFSGSMTSAFTDRLNTMLDNLNSTNADMMESLKTIRDGARQIAENLREVDTTIANSMGATQ